MTPPGAAPADGRLLLERRPPAALAAPVLDEAQARVVAHRDGPLLVLAGPGTGKTTTVVESVVARLTDPERPAAPESVLVLTFGRRAAAELRDRIAARVGGGVLPMISTFHSFCYALVRAESDAEVFPRPLRLLSGPEQDLRVRELLQGSVAEGRVPWPDDLRAALGTRGLATEVRAVLARARSIGLDPDELAAVGRSAGVPAWAAIGDFAEEYLDVLDSEGVTDYTELVHRARLLLADPDIGAAMRRRFRAIYVDEYQDTDPAQVGLLRALAGPGSSLVVVGDPDQAIYAFRGADLGGLLRFRSEFPRTDGTPAPVVVLDRSRRFGPEIRQAATRILGGRGLPGIPAADLRRHRRPETDPARAGTVEVVTYDDEGARAAHVAELLRRARLESRSRGDAALRWSDMAVVVRSGVRDIPRLRRALVAAGVPVEVAGDEVPLAHEPAVAPLLLALRVAADPAALTPDVATGLLESPLGGADPGDVRRLGRELRRRERALGVPGGPRPRPSRDLLREAVAEPGWLTDVDEVRAGPALAAVRRLGRTLRAARDLVLAGAAPEEVLWRLWAGPGDAALRGGWPARLERAALAGGVVGRRADRDLDAVCALFDTAERAATRTEGVKGAGAFLAELEGQAIPAETLAEQAVRGDAVRVLTAHRAKGLEWRFVVVAGAEEGSWPDVRPRGSLLLPDRLDRDGLREPPRPADLLAEERRLFYVACTRARERLVVTAVRAPAEDGPQPSRFLDDLAVAPVHVAGRPERPLSVTGLVAALRRTTVDPAASPALRNAAIARLALLADARTGAGRPLVPAADPASWWGVGDPTPGVAPVRPTLAPVALSGSALEGLASCPLRWFLSREARGESPRSTAIGFGSLVHAIAERVGTAELPPDLDVLDDVLGRVWDQLGFEASWQSARERDEARAALSRFLAYHGAGGRRLVATERSFDIVLRVPGPDGTDHDVHLRGALDRVEVDVDGRLHLVDLKTGRHAPTTAQVQQHAQLGVYQVAVAAGALDAADPPSGPSAASPADLPADPSAADPPAAGPPAAGPPAAGPLGRHVSGASLVHLRLGGGRGSAGPKVQTQPRPEPAEGEGVSWVERALGEAADRIRREDFPARAGQFCRMCEFHRSCPTRPEGAAVAP